MDRAGRPAAGDQPLGVQRRAAGEHRVDDPQLRVARAPPGREGVPGRAHVGDVAGQRGPPRRAPSGRDVTRGPGWTKSGAPRASRRSSSGATWRRPRRSASAAAGREIAERAGVEEVVDVGCARGVEADGAPQRERLAELEDAAVEGVEQRLGLVGREGLDAEGARQGDDDAVDVVELRRGWRGRGPRGRTRRVARRRGGAGRWRSGGPACGGSGPRSGPRGGGAGGRRCAWWVAYCHKVHRISRERAGGTPELRIEGKVRGARRS